MDETKDRENEGYGIKIVNIDDVDHIDVTIDGADEVDKNFNGIKGGGSTTGFYLL